MADFKHLNDRIEDIYSKFKSIEEKIPKVPKYIMLPTPTKIYSTPPATPLSSDQTITLSFPGVPANSLVQLLLTGQVNGTSGFCYANIGNRPYRATSYIWESEADMCANAFNYSSGVSIRHRNSIIVPVNNQSQATLHIVLVSTTNAFVGVFLKGYWS